jgi:hypothetical protein
LLRKQRQEDREDHKFKASSGKVRETLSQKQNEIKGLGTAQEVKYLPAPAKLKALGSIPSIAKKKKKKNKNKKKSK